MGRYMRKCRGIGELAVMEVSQVVGVRTRAMSTALAQAAKAAKRRKAVVSSKAAAEYQIEYLQLRSRSLVMTTPRISGSGIKISGSPRCLTPDRGEISQCESNASCEVADLRSDDPEVGDKSASAMYDASFRRESGETPPLSHPRDDELYDLESTAERRSPRRSTVALMPSDAEIGEFFAAAEKRETLRFANTYNYDVVNDVPLEGRFDWVPVSR